MMEGKRRLTSADLGKGIFPIHQRRILSDVFKLFLILEITLIQRSALHRLALLRRRIFLARTPSAMLTM